MDVFLQIVTSFPTVVYTVLLLVVSAHWLLSALGILEVDTIDGLMPDGFGGHGAGHGIGHGLGHGAAHGIGHDIGHGVGHGIGHGHDIGHGGHHHDADAGGLLMKFGLHGVPVMVVFTIIAIVGWSVCYFTDLFLLRDAKLGVFAIPADIATMIAGLVLAIPVGRMVLAPVRRILRRFAPVSQRPMLGRYGVVRSPEITQTSGTAEVDDGGAGLILQVRAPSGTTFQRGDRVVLLSFDEQANAYAVMSESEFLSR